MGRFEVMNYDLDETKAERIRRNITKIYNELKLKELAKTDKYYEIEIRSLLAHLIECDNSELITKIHTVLKETKSIRDYMIRDINKKIDTLDYILENK